MSREKGIAAVHRLLSGSKRVRSSHGGSFSLSYGAVQPIELHICKAWWFSAGLAGLPLGPGVLTGKGVTQNQPLCG